MGYKVTFDNGFSVNFDTKPSEDDIEEAYAHTKTLGTKKQGTSEAAAFGKSAVESVIPSATGLAGGIKGAAIGAGFGGVPGAIMGGIAGGLGAGYLGEKAQSAITGLIPEDIKESLGFGKEQRAAETKENPYWSFAGGLLPNVAAFRPGAIPEIVTQSGKVITPMMQRAGMAGLGGAIEAGTELATEGQIDPKKVAMAGAFQGVFAAPTKLGQRFMDKFGGVTPVETQPKTKLDKMRAEEAAKTPPVTEEAPVPNSFGEMANQLAAGQHTPYDAQTVLRQQEGAGLEGTAAALSDIGAKERIAAVEQELAARQAELEQAVKRQQTLDFNASERARQEAASAVSEAHRAYEQAKKDAADSALAQRAQQGTQEDLFGNPELFDLTQEGQLPPKVTPEMPTQQGELFEPQTNMHRDFTDLRVADGKGGERPLNAKEFQTVLQNLSKEEGTRFNMPEDIQAAYKQYLDSINERQGGLFDIGSRQEAFKASVLEQQIPRRVAEHPAAKRIAETISKQEQIVFKLQMDIHDGKNVQAHLDRAIRDLANLETKEQQIHTSVAARLKEGLPQNPYGKDYIELNAGIPIPSIAEIKAMVKDITDLVKWVSSLIKAGYTSLAQVVRATAGAFGKEFPQVADKLSKAYHIATAQVPLSGETIPQNPTSEAIINAAKESPGKGNIINALQSGGSLTAMKTASGLIREGVRVVQNQLKRADLGIRNAVYPMERAMRNLSRNELIELAAIFKDEALNNRAFSMDVLEKNLTRKQLDAYARKREMDEQSLAAVNAERTRQGKPPVDEKEFYLSSRWEGPFRQGLRDAHGKMVWRLAAGSKRDLQRQITALQKEVPGLIVDKKDYAELKHGYDKGDLQSGYTLLLDVLGRDDPTVKALKERYEELQSQDIENAFNQPKHFEEKHNIRGFIGDRPGRDPYKEAIAMMDSAAQYAKSSFRWSALQQAGDTLKPVFADEVLLNNQTEQLSYLKEYWKGALGQGQAKVFRALDDAFQATGYSSKEISDAVNRGKSFFILQKMGFNIGSTAAQVLQTSQVLPHLTNLLAQGFKGNPVRAIGMGVPAGMAMAANHVMNKMGMNPVNHMIKDPFYHEMFKYAEENGVTTRTLYDEAGVETPGANLITRFGDVAGKTLSFVDSSTRGVAFATFAEFLKSSGKFDDNIKLFQRAEELTDVAMADYRGAEKPMLFSKTGQVGNFMNTLQTYPMNFYNQWGLWMREVGKGNYAPFIVALGLQALLAGTMGMPYVESSIDLFNYIKDNMVSDKQWAKWQNNPMLKDPKGWLIDTIGAPGVYGWLSEKTDVAMTSRLSAPGIESMASVPFGVAADLGKQALSVGKAVAHSDNPRYGAEALMSVLPTGLAGLYETSDAAKGLTYLPVEGGGQRVFKRKNLASDPQVVFERTPEEVALRKLGLRSQREVKERDLSYATNAQNRLLDEKASGLVKDAALAMADGNQKEFNELKQLYARLKGTDITADQLFKVEVNRRLTDKERLLLQSTTPSKMIEAAKLRQRLEAQ